MEAEEGVAHPPGMEVAARGSPDGGEAGSHV